MGRPRPRTRSCRSNLQAPDLKITIGTLLLVSPARAQVGIWLEGLWPTFPEFPEQIPLPRADILFDRGG
jgi:hypothetical protein